MFGQYGGKDFWQFVECYFVCGDVIQVLWFLVVCQMLLYVFVLVVCGVGIGYVQQVYVVDDEGYYGVVECDVVGIVVQCYVVVWCDLWQQVGQYGVFDVVQCVVELG